MRSENSRLDVGISAKTARSSSTHLSVRSCVLLCSCLEASFSRASPIRLSAQPAAAYVGQWLCAPLEAMTGMLDRSLNLLRGPAT